MPNRHPLSLALLIPAFAAIVIGLTCIPGCDPPPPEGKEIGNLAPEVVGEDIDGKPIRLSDYRGKVVLLDFWGTWCPPCRAMIPHEREMIETKYKDRPFVILGVAQDSAETLKEFLKTNPMPWPNIVDQNRIVEKQWGVHQLPTLVLIDHKGVIRERWQGAAMNDILREVAKAVSAAESP
jgi:peroxiredoxin